MTAGGLTSAAAVQLPPDDPSQPSALAPDERLVQTTTDAAGLQVQSRESRDGTVKVGYPDGTTVSLETVPDQRLGALAPFTRTATTRLLSGLQQVVSTARSEVVVQAGSLDLTSWSETSTVNGRSSTVAYDATQLTVTGTSPQGRQAITQLDGLGRVTQEQVSGVNPVSYGYEARGRLSSIQQGPAGSQRVTTYGYGADGFLASVQDPLGRIVRYQRDPVGRVTKQILPDGQEVNFTYDANGSLASLTPPSRPVHTFDHDPVEDVSAYTPPALAQGGSATTFAYNLDHQLTTVTRPDQQTITAGYDGAGRLSSLTTPTGAIGYGYDAASGNLTTITAPAGGGSIAYSYDGPLTTNISVAGPAPGTIEFAYDRAADGSSNFWVTSRTLDGDQANKVNFTYDADGLVTQAGNLKLYRDPANALLQGSELLNTGAGIMIDDTIGAKALVALGKWVPRPVWRAASALFSANAKGDVLVFLRGSMRPGAIFMTTEKPIIEFLRNARMLFP